MNDVNVDFNPFIFLTNAGAAFALNMSVFMLIGRTSALTMNVAGVIKVQILAFRHANTQLIYGLQGSHLLFCHFLDHSNSEFLAARLYGLLTTSIAYRKSKSIPSQIGHQKKLEHPASFEV